MNTVLRVTEIAKTFSSKQQDTHALAGVNMTVNSGEFVCLLGPSGSGKSTLLRIIGGLIQPTDGTISLYGNPIRAPHADVGFVFQKTNLMPWRTVVQNVLLPIEVEVGKVGSNDKERACELLTLVGLEGFADAYPQQLSGGMSQRVVLARTLIQQPKLLLMDEPFGALDSLTRERLNLELLRIQRIHESTIVMVTHNISEAVLLADRVLILSERPGTIQHQVVVNLPRPRSLDQLGDRPFGELTTEIRQCLGTVKISL